MTVFSHGYAGSTSPEKEEAFSLFAENLDLIRTNSAKILETAEYFFCVLPFAWCSWPYVGGDGPLNLGLLLLGWQDGIFVEPCPGCGGECLVTSFSGSPLSGSNSWFGYCPDCKTIRGNRDTVHKPFYKKLDFVCELRKRFPQQLNRWEQYDGNKFSFGGNGLEPSLRKRMRTIELFEAIALPDVIEELRKGIERPRNNPESGFEGESPGLKLSSS